MQSNMMGWTGGGSDSLKRMVSAEDVWTLISRVLFVALFLDRWRGCGCLIEGPRLCNCQAFEYLHTLPSEISRRAALVFPCSISLEKARVVRASSLAVGPALGSQFWIVLPSCRRGSMSPAFQAVRCLSRQAKCSRDFEEW